MLAIALAVCISILLYLYGTRNFKYWDQRGVKHDKPLPLFGNALPKFLQKIGLSDMYSEVYRRYPNERYVGFYLANDLRLILRDPELIKHVLVTDFQHFHPRGLMPVENDLEPMLKNLFFADGDLWKLLRQRLTAAFTSGKLKAMFPLIVERAEKLQKIAVAAAGSGAEVDVRDLMARYTTDFIGTYPVPKSFTKCRQTLKGDAISDFAASLFGIDTDSLNDESSTFRQLGKRAFTRTRRDNFVAMLKFVAPKLFKKLHFLVPEIEVYTMSLVKSILAERNYRPSGRNDFIDLLLELQQKGAMVGESIEKTNDDGTPRKVELVLDEVLLAAQVLVFFAAGFETSSSATSYLLHQLAFHPEAQRRCQQEIDEVLRRHDGKLCYEAVKEMKYLEMCFREGMRMYPSLGFLVRRCVSTYPLPGTDVTIDKGVSVVVPIHALQTDGKYFDEPEQFRPERFSEVGIPSHVYLPFGEGPRACIGERLGLMQSLAGLAALLARVQVVPAPRTRRAPRTDPASTVTQIVCGGLPLTLINRHT